MLDLQDLANGLGNAALKALRFWPESGEGRSVKASAERMSRMLDATHDRSGLDFHIDNLEAVVSELKALQTNAFFQEHVASQQYIDRKGKKFRFGEALTDRIAGFDNFVSTNRPPRKASGVPSVEARALPPMQNEPKKDLTKALTDLAPGQQPGPLQFEFRDGLLRLKRQRAIPAASDAKNVASA